jgi:hypothetical protein
MHQHQYQPGEHQQPLSQRANAETPGIQIEFGQELPAEVELGEDS